MLTEERYAKILELLDQKGSVTITGLVERIGTSESTIRRDLNELDRLGRIEKVRGGAISIDGPGLTTKDDEVLLRKGRNVKEKNMVAKYAASLIEPGDMIYLDAGTTTELMIDYLTEKSAVFVTNAIGHAKKLAAMGVTVYLLGGEFKSTTEAIVGEEALYILRKYNFSKGFFGTNGITKKRGFTTPEVKEALIKEEAMAHSKKKYVLADETKFGTVSAISFGEFQKATILTNHVNKAEFGDCKNIVEVGL